MAVHMQTMGFEAFNDHARTAAVLGDRLGRLIGDSKTPAPEKKQTFMIYGRPFEVDVKYVPMDFLGMGAFGLVYSCLNQETGERVAIKKIGGALCNRSNAIATLREMQILRKIRHENIISLKDVMVSSPSEVGFQDVYLVQELMDHDLQDAIDSMRLSGTDCRDVLFKILRGVEFLHSANVVHRDLKPENILVRKNGDVKISDFGHARTRYKDSGPMNVNIGTRWYVAPEILLGSRDYEDSVDMWSVGCIFAEMLIGEPMFNGKDALGQISQIFGFLGKQTDLGFVESSKTRKFLEELPPSRLSDSAFRRLYWDADPVGIDLLERMLVLDPKKRISAKEALEHAYFSGMHVSFPLLENPVRSSRCVRLEVDENPNRVNEEMVRKLIWEEVLLYRRQQQQQVYCLF